jgi:hypothetical protein
MGAISAAWAVATPATANAAAARRVLISFLIGDRLFLDIRGNYPHFEMRDGTVLASIKSG